ncbi:NUDIX domain-containing protein [Candidatus Kuenenbacteria bacterium]|nr:NUDIX domain-containing protein [Candidatus Kuenenbacteria bacterium]
MANKRVSAIIIESEKILLMHRIKPDEDYFVLPGGSVEENENNISALIREIEEETSLEIEVGKLLWQVNSEFDERTQYIYLVSKHSGDLKLGSPEKERQSEDNRYILGWHDIKDLKTVKFFPSEIKTKIIERFLGDIASRDYQARFQAQTDDQLIESFNREVGSSGWTTSRSAYLTALREEFDARGFDYSAVGNKKGLSYKEKIELVGGEVRIVEKGG